MYILRYRTRRYKFILRGAGKIGRVGIVKPRCEKFMPRSQVFCNRPAGHTGSCAKIDRAKSVVSNAAWVAANPERRAAASAAWRAANPERWAAINAAWAKNNPERKKAQKQKRRAARRGATTVPFTQAELKARMTSLGDACFYCALLGLVGPHECDDHFFPLQPSKGHRRGPHALWNLYPSCTHHNSEKHNKQPIDFINKLLAT